MNCRVRSSSKVQTAAAVSALTHSSARIAVGGLIHEYDEISLDSQPLAYIDRFHLTPRESEL